MNENQIISSNFPWCEEWDESSFIGYLHDYAMWDYEKYWQLELSLYNICKQNISFEMKWRIFKIFSSTMMMFCSHFDQNDVFKIKNLSNEEIFDLRERVQLVFEGIFQNKMPNQDIFDLKNPLLSE
jgi:hypothetical protein